MKSPKPGMEEKKRSIKPPFMQALPKRRKENIKPKTESQMNPRGGARNCMMKAVKVMKRLKFEFSRTYPPGRIMLKFSGSVTLGNN